MNEMCIAGVMLMCIVVSNQVAVRRNHPRYCTVIEVCCYSKNLISSAKLFMSVANVGSFFNSG